MTDAGIGDIALVVVVEGLAGMAEERSVAIRPMRLYQTQTVAALGNAVGDLRLVAAIVGVDLLTQDAALERPTGLTHFVGGQVIFR